MIVLQPRSSRKRHARLNFVLSVSLGFAVEICSGPVIVDGIEAMAHEVVRGHRRGRGRTFWRWYLRTQPQQFSTPEAAASAFLESWIRWRMAGRPTA